MENVVDLVIVVLGEEVFEGLAEVL